MIGSAGPVYISLFQNLDIDWPRNPAPRACHDTGGYGPQVYVFCFDNKAAFRALVSVFPSDLRRHVSFRS